MSNLLVDNSDEYQLKWLIGGTDVTGKVTRILLKMPDGTEQEFDVVWEKKRADPFVNAYYQTAYLVHDFYGWEQHVNLKRLNEMTNIMVVEYKTKSYSSRV